MTRAIERAVACVLPLLFCQMAVGDDVADPFGPAAERPAGWREYVGDDGRVTTVYGPSLSSGPSSAASAQQFMSLYAESLFGVPVRDVVRSNVRGLKYDAATGAPEFELVRFEHRVMGLPVFASEARVLVRPSDAEADSFSTVLVRSSLRPVAAPGAESERRVIPLAMAMSSLSLHEDRDWEVVDSALCVWAGTSDVSAPSRLAYRIDARYGKRELYPEYGRRLFVVDATDGRVLLDRDLLLYSSAPPNGRVTATLTSGFLPAEFGPVFPFAVPLANVRVLNETAGGFVFSNSGGQFAIPALSGDRLRSDLNGEFFAVRNRAGTDRLLTDGFDGFVTFYHEALDEFELAQNNAFFQANIARQWALTFEPEFPGLNQRLFVYVNDDGGCNAFYETNDSMSFFRAGGGCPNTAYSSVIHHEYGHHLVESAGSGQGAYGEGFADTVALLIADDPGFAYGFFGDPAEPFRDARDVVMADCDSSAHECGVALSGAVWATRELLVEDSVDYRDTLNSLLLSSVQLHVGQDITPEITIDLLMLDDDDADLENGTPHRDAIASGFGSRGMPAPRMTPVLFRYGAGAGRPSVIDPRGGEGFVVEVASNVADPRPMLGTLHMEVAGDSSAVALSPMGDATFSANFPSMPCGATVRYRLRVPTMDNVLVSSPGLASEYYTAIVATGARETFVDDFESDLGWTVTDDGVLTDGSWERGAPAGSGVRYDPIADADGSGSCFLTRNGSGNDDVDNGSTTLTSPRLDATGGNVVLSYYRWFANPTDSAPRDDVFLVEISPDDGSTWQELERVGPTGPGTDGGWEYAEFTLSELIEPTDALRVRFIASDTGFGSIVEAGVDGFMLSQYPCDTGCLCDPDGDGTDIHDLLAFVGSWFATGEMADLDLDGGVTINDLLLFLGCWFESCG